MRVSVVIPALNEAATLGRSVDQAWCAGADEVIVVDGGSRDVTAQIARARQCTLLTSPPGRALQQNAGARLATGDVLLFQHADNWLEANAVQQVHRALEDPHCPGGAFRQRIEARGLAYRLLEWGNALRVRVFRLPYGDQGIFLRRSVFEDMGGFPEVPIMEDLLLMSSFRRRARLVLLPGPIHVSPRRWQRNGIIRQTLRNWSLVAGYRAGVPLERLATRYEPHDVPLDKC